MEKTFEPVIVKYKDVKPGGWYSLQTRPVFPYLSPLIQKGTHQEGFYGCPYEQDEVVSFVEDIGEGCEYRNF